MFKLGETQADQDEVVILLLNQMLGILWSFPKARDVAFWANCRPFCSGEGHSGL